MSKKTALPKQKKGSNTQEHLLEAAVDIFGRHGFEAATTRMIAREAGANIAAIPYYYSGKEGLYKAAVSYIVTKVETQVAAVLEEIRNRSFTGAASRKEALELLERLLVKIINFMVGSPQAPRVARIILREQLYPSSAYEIIFNGFLAPVLDAIATLIMAITGERSPYTAKLRAMAVIGQIIAFRVGRETIMRSLDMEGYNTEEMTEIRRIILEQTHGAMEALTQQ